MGRKLEVWWRLRENLPYHVDMRHKPAHEWYNEAFVWCRERYGDHATHDGMLGTWRAHFESFHFETEQQAVEFNLRWS